MSSVPPMIERAAIEVSFAPAGCIDAGLRAGKGESSPEKNGTNSTHTACAFRGTAFRGLTTWTRYMDWIRGFVTSGHTNWVEEA